MGGFLSIWTKIERGDPISFGKARLMRRGRTVKDP